LYLDTPQIAAGPQHRNIYKGGVDTFLKVYERASHTSQNQRNGVDILRCCMDASVLIKALGGWSATELPKDASLC